MNNRKMRVQGGVSLLYDKISLSVTQKISRQAMTETPPCIRMEASYIVELTAVLPFFAAFMAILLFFFQILCVQQEVGNALLWTGRELSVLACSDDGKSDSLLAAQALMLKNLKKGSAAELFIRHGRSGVLLVNSDFSGDYIFLQADYRIRLPIGLFGTRDMNTTQKLKCRKWTGESGGSLDEEIVYITPAGSVYHKKQNCSYLAPSVTEAEQNRIGAYRNEDGGKYYPCESCMNGKASKNQVVYITKYGDRYHCRRDCKKIKHIVLAIRLSEVEGRKACSKCGKELP